MTILQTKLDPIFDAFVGSLFELHETLHSKNKQWCSKYELFNGKSNISVGTRREEDMKTHLKKC